MKTKLLVIVLFIISVKIDNFGMGFKSKYLPIDSLTKNFVGAQINLDLKNKALSYYDSKSTILFRQSYLADTTGYYFHPKNLEHRDSVRIYYFTIERFIDMNQDSIFVVARYSQWNSNEKKAIETKKVKRFGIAKHELMGIVIGPTKKQTRRFFAFFGGMALGTTTVQFLFGQ